ncbi:stage II sporulation protein M [Auraticoccus monumenti]|uniref:Stage II sporulation protein M n=1 Tax=Auraticoccus monumenti TaxID=675864 RepID=A0A1G7C913_9ACTN|nr:stage II sporulation protein M [Auraticoccus monumenti]SDE35872.1 Stage II sporulation protein M [Auraticoccus monumenti]
MRLRRPFQIVRAHLGAYLILNALLYGLFLLGFAAGLVFPGLSTDRTASLEADGTAALVASLLSTPWLFALVILGVNVITVGLLSIVLPSLVIPFAGIVVMAYQAFTLGATLSPTDDRLWLALIPHSLTAVIEFQAYVLLSLGAFVLGRSWLRPATVGVSTRRQAYLLGLRQLGWLGLLALALLVLGAVYEALSLRYLVPLLLRG